MVIMFGMEHASLAKLCPIARTAYQAPFAPNASIKTMSRSCSHWHQAHQAHPPHVPLAPTIIAPFVSLPLIARLAQEPTNISFKTIPMEEPNIAKVANLRQIVIPATLRDNA